MPVLSGATGGCGIDAANNVDELLFMQVWKGYRLAGIRVRSAVPIKMRDNAALLSGTHAGKSKTGARKAV